MDIVSYKWFPISFQGPAVFLLRSLDFVGRADCVWPRLRCLCLTVRFVQLTAFANTRIHVHLSLLNVSAMLAFSQLNTEPHFVGEFRQLKPLKANTAT